MSWGVGALLKGASLNPTHKSYSGTKPVNLQYRAIVSNLSVTAAN